MNKLVNFDILLHPSYREWYFVFIMQSLQYGVPVLQEIYPNVDIIKNNFNGYLFNNEIEMINYIKKIYYNRS